ncbi:Peptidyl-Lys metalloendopeptidase [Leucoagaricus sp. SymC.cos]|nr:Peptidyl-Lys metalloendopeptidase [Leucoagaricus sp. SymC.cos]
MLTLTVRSALFTLAASAVAANDAQSASLKVTGPESVSSIENLKVTTTITNTGDEALKLLHDPLSPLSQFQDDSFKIIGGAKNATPSFKAIMTKFIPSIAFAQKACTALALVESVNVEHDLSKAYDFTKAGEGPIPLRLTTS